ncbi:MGMT family protein [Patescibacteria group bacterium]|jgi:O-6-methylguanine DNA methyltransferase|nr:MGMT family protein [Patescibacteria group bacterium]MCL5114474.1 MGMT family protein [Patescibacteria group bacterium]
MKKELPFGERVYRATQKIPKGKVATYGDLARLAGNPRAARAVGHFMKVNPGAPIVPCHRVVASNGALTGYSAEGGLKKKEKMLRKEGVIFRGNRVDLRRSRWKK